MRKRVPQLGGGRHLVALSAGVLGSWAVAAASPGPVTHLVNPLPQRTACPATEERPLYYPRSLRSRAESADAQSPEALARDLFDLHTAMRYELAAAVARRLVEIAPASASAHYNLAAVLGRLRRTEEALDALSRAVDLGWRDLTHLLLDPDLDTLRVTGGYRAIVSRLRELIAAEPANVPQSVRGDSAHPGALPPPPPEVAGEAGLRVIALAALVRHGAEAWPEAADLARRSASERRDPPAVAPQQVVRTVESATSEPFPASCRRLVLGPLGLDQTAFATDAASGLRVETTPGDLGLVLQYLARCAQEPADGPEDLAGLARSVGLSAEREGEGLRISYRSGRGLVVLQYDPPAPGTTR